MKKLIVRVALLALAASTAMYGCGDESDAPTSPSTRPTTVKLLDVPICGEASYLDELSPLLPVWQDSLGAWLPGATLNDAPAFEGGAVVEYLSALVPVLQQWRGSVNTELGAEVLAAIGDFNPESTTTQDYLPAFSDSLSSWEGAAEAERGMDFLPTLPLFEADNFAPVIECPADTTIACADSAGVVLEFAVGATDDCDEAPVVVCEPESGSTFLPGTTTVTCTATDASGNESSCSFDVTVEADIEGPMLSCPADIFVDCSIPEGSVVEFEVTAIDDCDDAPTIVSDPESGSVFPVGTTTVTSTATDSFGNSTTCSFDVTVEAAEVSILDAAATPDMLWAPNHKMVEIGFDLDIDNECALELTCTVLEVTSNEPINGLGDGNTEPDWMIGEDGTLKLRAERSGSDRVYTIRLRCEHEDSGIGDETTVEVVVPHDRGR